MILLVCNLPTPGVQLSRSAEGYEFEQTLGDSEGQGSLVCYSPWRCKESGTTDQLNNDDKNCLEIELVLVHSERAG